MAKNKPPNPFTNELARARQIINAAEQHAATMSPEVRTMVLDRLNKILNPAPARDIAGTPSQSLQPIDE